MARKINIPTEKISALFRQIPFFLKQLPLRIMPFLKSLPARIKAFPNRFMSSPVDEKIAYSAIGAGIIFFLIGIIL